MPIEGDIREDFQQLGAKIQAYALKKRPETRNLAPLPICCLKQFSTPACI
jgi:hypothetical protein